MYVSVRRYTIGASSIDALAHRLEEEFAPAISQEPGFLGYLAIDAGEGTVERSASSPTPRRHIAPMSSPPSTSPSSSRHPRG